MWIFNGLVETVDELCWESWERMKSADDVPETLQVSGRSKA